MMLYVIFRKTISIEYEKCGTCPKKKSFGVNYDTSVLFDHVRIHPNSSLAIIFFSDYHLVLVQDHFLRDYCCEILRVYCKSSAFIVLWRLG